MTTAADLLALCRARGVVLFVEGSRLRYRGPEGAITDDLLAAVKARRAEVLALLAGRDPPQEWRWETAILRECLHASADPDVRRQLVALHAHLTDPPPGSEAEWIERARELVRVEGELRGVGKWSGRSNWR